MTTRDLYRTARLTKGSRARAMRRLRLNEPALFARVAAGELSAHAAMVAAGHRKPTFSVRADSPEALANTLRRRLTPEQVAELVQHLTVAREQVPS